MVRFCIEKDGGKDWNSVRLDIFVSCVKNHYESLTTTILFDGYESDSTKIQHSRNSLDSSLESLFV